jgi:hypothetical protein
MKAAISKMGVIGILILLAPSSTMAAIGDFERKVDGILQDSRTATEINRLDSRLSDLDGTLRRLKSQYSSLQRRRSIGTFQSLVSTRKKLMATLRTKGIQAFSPLNEGSIRSGKTKIPQCPSNAHAVLDFCECDAKYSFNGLNKCVAKEFKLDMSLEERMKAFDDFSKDGGYCPEGESIPSEYPATKFMCEVVNPYW